PGPGQPPSPVSPVARASFNRNDSPLPTLAPSDPSIRGESSVITDLGGQLSYDYRQSRALRFKPSKPKPSAKTRNELESRLFDALEDNKSSQGGKGFFAQDMLTVLLPEQTVAKKLTKHLGKIYVADAIDQLARQICSETRHRAGGAKKVKVETYRKVFAILVLIGKPESVVKFLQARVSDADLPLVRLRSPATGDWSMRRHRDLTKELGCFKTDWCELELRNFDHWQWTTLSPFFALSKGKEVNHYRLQDEITLPFVDEHIGYNEHPNKPATKELLGGGGRVFKVRIHPEHHSFHGILQVEAGEATTDTTSIPPLCNCLFAVKELHSHDRTNFKQEVDTLKKFSNNAHMHLITLLATYEQRGAYFLIFPRAEADLQAYWQRTPSPLLQASLPIHEQVSAVRWVAAQCLGLAKGLSLIHRYRSSHSRLHPLDAGNDSMYGHHGDIKPENVLWFADRQGQASPGGGGLGGTLKLSDFGLARFSPHRTMSRYHDVRAAAMTRTYAAPECDLSGPGGEGVKGRQFDMWTLGCLYLEFATWLVGGWEGVQRFKEARESVDVILLRARTDTFFTLREDARTGPYAIVKPSVTKFIKNMRTSKRCTPYVHDLLDLIQDGLLVVKETNPSLLGRDKGRYSIEQASAKLNKMVINCISEEYCCGKPQVSASPNPSSRPKLATGGAREETAKVGRKAVTFADSSLEDRPGLPVWF
ncbi:putative Serine/threonine-protein kinase, partial [Podospora conica]